MTPADFAALCVPTGCVIFTGAHTSKGYGSVRHPVTGRVDYAHRVAWELAYGPIPDGFDLDHAVCRVHACVRLDHLQLIEHAEHAAKDARAHQERLARAG